jgi:hypothetical protein
MISHSSLIAEAENIILALSVILCHLLSQPATLSNLERELAPVIHDPKKLPTWAVLEKLPYLISLPGFPLCSKLAFDTPCTAPSSSRVFASLTASPPACSASRPTSRYISEAASSQKSLKAPLTT